MYDGRVGSKNVFEGSYFLGADLIPEAIFPHCKTGFKLALDELNIVVLEGRAQRLFNLCDLDGSGIIGVSELEVALMVHDVLPTTSYMTPVDLFHVFDLDGGGDISWVEFKVPCLFDFNRNSKRETGGVIVGNTLPVTTLRSRRNKFLSTFSPELHLQRERPYQHSAAQHVDFMDTVGLIPRRSKLGHTAEPSM